MAPLTSAIVAIFGTFEVMDDETDIMTVPFRQWYFDADADAELTKQLKSRPAVSNLTLYRIKKS
jgi:hypothetical protein